MPARRTVIAHFDEYSSPTVLATHPNGQATDRRIFPTQQDALVYAGVLARRLGATIIDRLTPAPAPRIIVARDAFDLGFDVECPGPEDDNPSRHFADRGDALAYAARIGAERGWAIDDQSSTPVHLTFA